MLLGKRRLEPFQRRNSFGTHYKSGGKIYNVIIDGGSTKNMVTKEMV